MDHRIYGKPKSASGLAALARAERVEEAQRVASEGKKVVDVLKIKAGGALKFYYAWTEVDGRKGDMMTGSIHETSRKWAAALDVIKSAAADKGWKLGTDGYTIGVVEIRRDRFDQGKRMLGIRLSFEVRRCGYFMGQVDDVWLGKEVPSALVILMITSGRQDWKLWEGYQQTELF